MAVLVQRQPCLPPPTRWSLASLASQAAGPLPPPTHLALARRLPHLLSPFSCSACPVTVSTHPQRPPPPMRPCCLCVPTERGRIAPSLFVTVAVSSPTHLSLGARTMASRPCRRCARRQTNANQPVSPVPHHQLWPPTLRPFQVLDVDAHGALPPVPRNEDVDKVVHRVGEVEHAVLGQVGWPFQMRPPLIAAPPRVSDWPHSVLRDWPQSIGRALSSSPLTTP